jgi:predicted transcriptional regulator
MMRGRTLSFYAEEDLARRLHDLAALEERKPSQLVAMALRLFTSLPEEARAAMRYAEFRGRHEDLVQAVTRAALDVEYAITQAELVEQMRRQGRPPLADEAAILDEAVRVTADGPP